MGQTFINNMIRYLDWDLNIGELSVPITTDVESNSVITITDPADLTLISDNGKSVERMMITAAAGVMTISLRGIKADVSGAADPTLQKKRYAGQRCFVTIFASHLITSAIFSTNNTWTGTNTFTGTTNVSNLNITGTSIPRPIFADPTARDLAIPTPIDGQHCRILLPWPYDQVYNGTTAQRENYGIGTPPPLASTTAAGLVKIATAITDPDQVAGVYNMLTVSQINSKIQTNVFGWDESRSLVCWENISTGQHCAIWTYIEWYTPEPDSVYQVVSGWYPGTMLINFWQCFNRQVDDTLVKIKMRMQRAGDASWNGNSITWSCVAKIYAITGIYPNALATWSALATSNSEWLNQAATNPYRWVDRDTTFTFNTVLPAWQYAVVVTWSFHWSNTYGWPFGINFLWDQNGTYVGNAFKDGNTPLPTYNSSFEVFWLAPWAILADATDITKIRYIWQSQWDYLIWQPGVFKYTQQISYPGSLINDLLYLSDIPWEASLTSWTYTAIIWRCISDWIFRIWYDNYMEGETITKDEVYYSSLWGVAGWKFSVSYGWINVGWYVSIYMSDDNITWVLVNRSGNINGNWGDNNPGCQAIIPAWKYFKVANEISSGWNITSSVCYFRPLK